MDLTFHGSDDVACEAFILAINRWAFDNEKQEDDRLVAQFAYSHMAGKMLRFYETLDDDVQGSWKLLRRALLDRYPPTE